MPHTLKLASETARPIRLRGRTRQPKVALVPPPQPADMRRPTETSSPKRPIPNAVAALQRLVASEAHLLDGLRAAAREALADPDERSAVMRALNSDNVFHVARFFFLMQTLRCDEPTSLATFLESHNERLAPYLKDDKSLRRSISELEKAQFDDDRIKFAAETTRIAERLALGKSEIADILFEHGARRSIIDAVNTLIKAGLLTVVDDEEFLFRSPRPDRKIIRSDGRIEHLYETYLEELSP